MLTDAARPAVLSSLIIGAVLVATAWIATAVLIRPANFWLDAVAVVPLLLAIAAFVMSLRRFGQDGSGSLYFVVREGRGFVIPPNCAFAYFVVGEVLLFGFLGHQAIIRWTDPTAGRVGLAVFMAVPATVFGGLVIAMVVIALSGRPRIELTPRAIVVRDIGGSRTIPWEALGPQRPVPGWHTVTVAFGRPELVVRRGLMMRRPRQIALHQVRVQPHALADMIQIYVKHPDRRDAIGTRAEYERLLQSGPELPAGYG